MTKIQKNRKNHKKYEFMLKTKESKFPRMFFPSFAKWSKALGSILLLISWFLHEFLHHYFDKFRFSSFKFAPIEESPFDRYFKLSSLRKFLKIKRKFAKISNFSINKYIEKSKVNRSKLSRKNSRTWEINWTEASFKPFLHKNRKKTQKIGINAISAKNRKKLIFAAKAAFSIIFVLAVFGNQGYHTGW